MKDYKKLIDNLRSNQNNTFQLEAADALEQLVKERDAAVADITNIVHDMGNTCICDYCVGCGKDGHHDECKTDEGDSWEWCGVQKEENDND